MFSEPEITVPHPTDAGLFPRSARASDAFQFASPRALALSKHFCVPCRC